MCGCPRGILVFQEPRSTGRGFCDTLFSHAASGLKVCRRQEKRARTREPSRHHAQGLAQAALSIRPRPSSSGPPMDLDRTSGPPHQATDWAASVPRSWVLGPGDRLVCIPASTHERFPGSRERSRPNNPCEAQGVTRLPRFCAVMETTSRRPVASPGLTIPYSHSPQKGSLGPPHGWWMGPLPESADGKANREACGTLTRNPSRTPTSVGSALEWGNLMWWSRAKPALSLLRRSAEVPGRSPGRWEGRKLVDCGSPSPRCLGRACASAAASPLHSSSIPLNQAPVTLFVT